MWVVLNVGCASLNMLAGFPIEATEQQPFEEIV